jgi:PIN domain nuclease of toxin-antitoxin system
MSDRSIRSTKTTTSITADVLLLDTHVWIWTLAGDARRIGRRARSLLTRAESRDAIRISPVTLFEVMALHTIGRLQLKRPPDEWIRLAMTTAPVRIAELSPAIAIDAGRIPRDVLVDPVDRLLVATALEMEATLLTADDRILQYGVRSRTLRTADAGR